ncbi:hypothetical protein Fmac_017834 [Flemingia macrophylla]|uniref:Uncharacterized protein n=1 Tax=Flemingia macrophylla TaxID=520843 RepID=A0ABD1M3B4_9FABA
MRVLREGNRKRDAHWKGIDRALNGDCERRNGGPGNRQLAQSRITTFLGEKLPTEYTEQQLWKVFQSYAFVVKNGNYTFSLDYLKGLSFKKALLVVDWTVGNDNCNNSKPTPDYACKNNSYCEDSNTGYGYRCRCENSKVESLLIDYKTIVIDYQSMWKIRGCWTLVIDYQTVMMRTLKVPSFEESGSCSA